MFAWAVSRTASREPLIRWHGVVTVAMIGAALTLTTVVGLPVWWIEAVYALGRVVCASWCLRLFDSFRHATSGEKAPVDPLREALGLTATRFGTPTHHDGRIVVPVTHGPGETAAVIQAALPGIESLAGGPAGRSRAVPDPDNASRSKVTIVTLDVL